MKRLVREKILHVLYEPTVGGCESLCADLLEHWHAAGRDQELVFLSPRTGPLLERLAGLSDLTIHVCPYRPHRRLTFIRRFARLCREQKITAAIVYCFGLHFFIGVGAKLGGVEVILATAQNPPPRDGRRRRVSALLAQLARPLITREVACSRHVARGLTQRYHLPSRRIAQISNWCNVAKIAQRAAHGRNTQQTGVGPVIGMIARLDSIKDHPTALRGFAQFLERFPNARLRLIGDGARRPVLVELADSLGISHAVEFLGTKVDVPEQLGALDIFAYATTEDEGFGIVLAEAMAAGVPIVATDIGPCAEVLAEGDAGLLIPPRDPGRLATALERLWLDPKLRGQLAAAGLATAQGRYSVEAAARRLDELIQH